MKNWDPFVLGPAFALISVRTRLQRHGTLTYHGQKERFGVLHGERLILELLSVDRLAASTC
jgi:hypothetical protein